MLINLSNHPSEKWTAEQINASAEFGNIVDISFPLVDPKAGKSGIVSLASRYKEEVVSMISNSQHGRNAVHIMGELTFCYTLVYLLQQAGITCLASTTERIVTQIGNAKTAEFNFCRFREYPDMVTGNHSKHFF